jgi:hypothetical protein
LDLSRILTHFYHQFTRVKDIERAVELHGEIEGEMKEWWEPLPNDCKSSPLDNYGTEAGMLKYRDKISSSLQIIYTLKFTLDSIITVYLCYSIDHPLEWIHQSQNMQLIFVNATAVPLFLWQKR